MTIPNHVAIIPDGNRRWAKKKGLPAFLGHREGAKTAEKIFKTALELKIPCITFWGSSFANITERSPQEVRFLFQIFKTYFKKLAADREIHAKAVRVRVIGRWRELFPEAVQKEIRNAIQKTKNYNNYHFTILSAYSGTDEMAQAISRLRSSFGGQAKIKSSLDAAPSTQLGINQGKQESKLTGETIKQYLWTKDLPPVDLVIRTGGEPHWSAGFMMWDVAEAKLHFSDTLWPSFSEKEFQEIIRAHGKQERRFGK